MNLKWHISTLIIFLTIACATKKEAPSLDGSVVFKTHCQLCHGADGKLGLNGAKDLSISPLSLEERIEVITNGRNTMISYANILSEEEINAVARHTTSLK